MGVLLSIERCINTLPKDLLAENVIYLELDKEKYEQLQNEVTTYTMMPDLKFVEQKIEEFGKCSIFNYAGYKIIIALDKSNKKSDTFYVAFKTRVI